MPKDWSKISEFDVPSVGKIKKVKRTLVQVLRLCTSRTAHRGGGRGSNFSLYTAEATTPFGGTILKLERYREDKHCPCARMTRKIMNRSTFLL